MRDVVDMLLKHATVSLEQRFGAHEWTLLMRMMYELDDSLIEVYFARLVKAGASVTAVNDEGKNALFFAVAASKRKGTKLLLDAFKQPAPKQSVDAFGNTPLHWCTDEYIAAALLASGFSATQQNKAGNTPVHFAYAAKAMQVVQVLEGKKKVNVANKNGNKPADCNGVGVDKFVPFTAADKSLKDCGGLLLRDQALQDGGVGYW